MKIGELATRAGVSPRLVRYYEQQELLSPSRQPNGYRAYDEEHVARVARIAGLVQSGLPTRLVKEVLELEDAAADERPSCPRTVADMLLVVRAISVRLPRRGEQLLLFVVAHQSWGHPRAGRELTDLHGVRPPSMHPHQTLTLTSMSEFSVEA